MMRRPWTKTLGAASIFLGVIWAATPVQAQLNATPVVPSGGGTMSPAAMLANPYMNPYLNPYINPAATQRPISGRDAAMYLYMANQANGGIGSGQISQTRPAPGAAQARVVNRPGGVPGQAPGPVTNAAKSRGRGKTPVAEMPDSASTPGSGAARFFNPGPVNSNGAGRYYSRRNTYFNSNGH